MNEFIEQKHILDYLKKSIEKDRVSHAYLFEGPKYLKIKEIALWFAKRLQCQDAKKSCDSYASASKKCRSCQDIEKNRHPDVIIVSPMPTNKIGIEQIRKLRRHLSLSPHSGPYKIAIIDSAEKMTLQAANALLKTLEEPRGNTVLILIANIISALPGTILSRCKEIKFKTIPLDKISKNFVKKEDINIIGEPLNNIFKYIENTVKKKSKTLILLDSWLFWFRDILVNNKKSKYSQKQLIKILKEIQKTKNLILNTNIDSRLALEVLALEL